MRNSYVAADPLIARDYLQDMPLQDIADRHGVSVRTIYNALSRQRIEPGERQRRTGGARLKAMWDNPTFRAQQAAKGRAALAALHAGTLERKPAKLKVPTELRADWRALKRAGYTQPEAAEALGLSLPN